MAGSPARLSDLMQRRRLELGMKTWRALALEAGVAYETLRALRAGENVTPGTAHALERALQWEHGSIAAIESGGGPMTLDTGEPERPPGKAGEKMQLIQEIRERLEQLERLDAQQGPAVAPDSDEKAG